MVPIVTSYCNVLSSSVIFSSLSKVLKASHWVPSIFVTHLSVRQIYLDNKGHFSVLHCACLKLVVFMFIMESKPDCSVGHL